MLHSTLVSQVALVVSRIYKDTRSCFIALVLQLAAGASDIFGKESAKFFLKLKRKKIRWQSLNIVLGQIWTIRAMIANKIGNST